MVACWLTMKEVSLLLGSLAKTVPLQSSAGDGGGGSAQASLLSMGQLQALGEHFLDTLLTMKHNGAVEKTGVGFTALASRMLRSAEAAHGALPRAWLERLLRAAARGGQGMDDVLRRSAGLPHAFMALLHAEPKGAPRVLLPRALEALLKAAEAPEAALCGDTERKSQQRNCRRQEKMERNWRRQKGGDRRGIAEDLSQIENLFQEKMVLQMISSRHPQERMLIILKVLYSNQRGMMKM